jgi:CDP-paratose synthetase
LALKVLVTGATGFVGKHLLGALLEDGHEVTGLHRRAAKCQAMKVLEGTGAVWKHIDQTDTLFLQEQFDCVVHLATSYGRNQSDAEVNRSNVDLPLALLERYASSGGTLFLNADSYYCKGGVEYPALRAYSKSKNVFRQLGLNAIQDTSCRFLTVRFEHIYGPQDSEEKFVSFLLRQFLQNVDQVELTNCEQVRDFIFVTDVCEALTALMKNYTKLPTEVEEVQVGTGQATRLVDFIETLAEKTGTKTKRVYGAITQRDGEIKHSLADLSWAPTIDWGPTFNVAQGIDQLLVEKCQ